MPEDFTQEEVEAGQKQLQDKLSGSGLKDLQDANIDSLFDEDEAEESEHEGEEH